jgi:hypothetical protein
MEDTGGALLSRVESRTLLVLDVATVMLSSSNTISLYVAKGQWNFQADLYVMCGEFRERKRRRRTKATEEREQEDEEVMLTNLGCRPLHSEWLMESDVDQVKGKRGEREGELRVSLMGVDGAVFGHSEWLMYVLL